MNNRFLKMIVIYLAFILGCFFAFSYNVYAGTLDDSFKYYFNSSVRYNTVKIYFVDNINAPDEAVEIYDVSEEEDESIIAWAVPVDGDKYYMYIGSEETIVFPQYSEYLFSDFEELNEIQFANIDTSNMETAYDMFSSNPKLKTIDLSLFNTSSLDENEELFDNSSIETVTISDGFTIWLTDGVWIDTTTNQKCIYYDFNHSGVTTYTRSKFYLGMKNNVLYMSNSPIENVDIEDGKRKEWTYFEGQALYQAFGSEEEIYSIVIGGPGDVISLISMNSMFEDLSELESINFTYIDTSNCVDMSELFFYDRSLESVNLSNFDTRSLIEYNNMFYYSIVSHIQVGQYWNIGFGFGEWKNSSGTIIDGNNIPEFVADTYEKNDYYWGINASNNTLYISNNPRTEEIKGRLDKNDVTQGTFWYFIDDLPEINNVIVGTSNTDIIAPNSMAYWFYDLEDATSFNFTYLNTSNVTSMKYTFAYNISVSSLNLSTFNTINVETMEGMFLGCNNLTNLNTSSFNTSKVETMEDMFSGCSSLTTLNLSNFNTEVVENLSYMFNGCGSLTTLNVSSFDTENVTTMAYMFNGCESLETINLSSFNTTNVENMNRMFYNTAINTLNLSNFNTENAIYYDSLFPVSLETITVGDDWSIGLDSGQWRGSDGTVYNYNEIPAYVADTYTRLALIWGINLDTATLYISNSPLDLPSNSVDGVLNLDGSLPTGNAPWYTYSYSIEHVVVGGIGDVVKPQYTAFWFDGLNRVESFNFANLDTSNVTDMSAMFRNCSVETLNLSTFNTAKVINMSEMFKYCENLTSVNLSSFNTSKVRDISEMFYYVRSLKTLDISNFNLSSLVIKDDVFNYSGITTFKVSNTFNGINLPEGEYTNSNGDLFDYNEIPSNTADTYKKYVMYYSIDSNGVLRINDYEMDGIIYGEVNGNGLDHDWTDYSDLITSVIVGSEGHIIRPIYMYNWFNGLTEVTSFNLTYLDTSRTEDMEAMFMDCESITSLDLSHFDTTKVEYLSRMFAGCINLTTLDLSNFRTPVVFDLYAMFNSCYSLTSVNISNLDTSIVTDFSAMFAHCTSLTKLDLGNFDTSLGEDFISMFYNCSKLKELNISSFNISENTDIDSMFEYCSALETIRLSSLAIFNSNDESLVFDGCDVLKILIQENTSYANTRLDLRNANGSAKSGKMATGDYVNATSSVGEPLKVEFVVLGDINKDGDVDIIDVMKAATEALKGNTLTKQIEILAADVNNDKEIDIMDVMKIATYALKGGKL